MSGTTAQEATQSAVSPVGVGLAVLGATLGIVAIFLPLVQNPGFPLGIQSNSLIQSDGVGTGIAIRYVICAVVILTLAYRYHSSGVGQWGILIPALILGVGAIVDMGNDDITTLYSFDPQSGGLDTGGESVEAEPAIALYVAAVGGFLAALGGLIMWRGGEDTGSAPSPTSATEARADFRTRAASLSAAPAAPSYGTRPADAAHDVADQIRKLDDLRRDGVLTDEEFQAKKTQLLR